MFAIISHVDLKNNLAMEYIATFLWFYFLFSFYITIMGSVIIKKPRVHMMI